MKKTMNSPPHNTHREKTPQRALIYTTFSLVYLHACERLTNFLSVCVCVCVCARAHVCACVSFGTRLGVGSKPTARERDRKNDKRLLARGSLWGHSGNSKSLLINYRTLRHWTGSLQAYVMTYQAFTLAD